MRAAERFLDSLSPADRVGHRVPAGDRPPDRVHVGRRGRAPLAEGRRRDGEPCRVPSAAGRGRRVSEGARRGALGALRRRGVQRLPHGRAGRSVPAAARGRGAAGAARLSRALAGVAALARRGLRQPPRHRRAQDPDPGLGGPRDGELAGGPRAGLRSGGRAGDPVRAARGHVGSGRRVRQDRVRDLRGPQGGNGGPVRARGPLPRYGAPHDRCRGERVPAHRARDDGLLRARRGARAVRPRWPAPCRGGDRAAARA